MGSSSPRFSASESARRTARRALPCVALLLAACVPAGGERASIISARPLSGVGGAELEVVQQLRLSTPMLDALDAGIPLRLRYRVDGCAGSATDVVSLELRYSALTRRYALRGGDAQTRYFSRRSALLGALDRVRLPLADPAAAGCAGSVQVALDITALPAPLRLPALLQPEEWRLTSAILTWPSANG